MKVGSAAPVTGDDLASITERCSIDTDVTRVRRSSVHWILQGEEEVLRVLRSRKKWGAATIGVALIGTLAAAVALGSPGSGNTITTLVTANFDQTVHLNSDRVKFQTKDATYVRVQKVVFAPNSRNGWHHHPGMALVTVESDSVTLWQSDCSSKTYGPGRLWVVLVYGR